MKLPLYPTNVEELSQIVQGLRTVHTDVFECLTWENSTYEERCAADEDCQNGQGSRPLDKLYAAKLVALLAAVQSSGGNEELISRGALSQVIDFQPENQVITVQAGIKLYELKKFLGDAGQTIPFATSTGFSALFGAGYDFLYNHIACGFPHTWMAQHGSWRDWILAAELVLADGTVVRTGAPVVKSVTGFDLHRLIVGSRDTLGLLTEVTLRTLPLASLQAEQLEQSSDVHHRWSYRYHRVLPSDWNMLCAWIRKSCYHFRLDHAACQAVYSIEPELERLAFEWESYQDFDKGESVPLDLTTQALMRRAKQVFDPSNKLNPGVFGFL